MALPALRIRNRTLSELAPPVVSAVVVGLCALFIFWSLHPSKLFSTTTPAGGDMGAHVWAPEYLRHHLLPHGRLSGWAQDWYDGFPALTFYFPLPYLVIALASYVLPYGIAFKLVSVSGLVALPVAVWAFGRLMRMRHPGPALLALASVPYLYDRYFTIWGGNIASTLAGEFSFSIGLALAFVFLGVFNRALETGRHRSAAGVLLAAIVLCHLLTAFFAILGAAILWFMRPSRHRLRVAATVGVLAAAVAAYWLVPFAFRLGYSNDMGWERTNTYLKGLFPFLDHSAASHALYTRHLKVVVALAAAGAVGGLMLRRRTTIVLSALGLTAAAAFRLMPQGALWNARALPFWYLCLYLVAGAGIAETASALGVLLGWRAGPEVPTEDAAAAALVLEENKAPRARVLVGAHAPAGAESSGPARGLPDPPADAPWDPPDPGGQGSRRTELVPSGAPGLVVPLLALVVALAFVAQSLPGWWHQHMPFTVGGAAYRHDQNFVSGWADWNYSGYERKAAYPEYRDVIDTMKVVGRRYGCGRAMWEYESEEDRFGTPMALMLLPKWTHGCIGSMEGLYFESSATVPYHFLNQSELSVGPSRAMRDLPYRGVDLEDGIAHLRLLGVRYYMAISPSIQAQARVMPGLALVASTGSHLVTYTKKGSTSEENRHWEVYEIEGSDVVSGLAHQPVVMTHVPVKAQGWIKLAVGWYQDRSRFDVMLAASGPRGWARVRGADPRPPRVAVRQAVVTNVRLTDDRVGFDVDQPGSPVLVKVSFFPNWQASGADGPWRVTPNLMVVVPTSHHVELHYGFTPVDNAGRLLTVGGLAAAAALAGRAAGGGRPQGSPLPLPEPAESEAVDRRE